MDGLFRQRNGEWVITLFLVNAQEEPKKLARHCLAVPTRADRDLSGWCSRFFAGAGFCCSRQADEEEKAMGMLYRQQVEFAVGHGVAVHAELAEGRYDQAVSLKTVIAPDL